MSVDPVRVAALLREVAEQEVLPRFQNLTPEQIYRKDANQLVTVADVETEKALTSGLQGILPGAVVGEETAGSLAELGQDGVVWILDPIDGTGNFVRGSTRFAVVVALVVNGETIAGWIHDPLQNRTAIAQKGGGAWQEGVRLAVAPEVPVEQMIGAVGRKEKIASHILRALRQGSMAHDYLDLAGGKMHFAHCRHLLPWDHAAGVLLHAEAGGYSAMLGDGTTYRPVSYPSGAFLVAPGKASWEALHVFFA